MSGSRVYVLGALSAVLIAVVANAAPAAVAQSSQPEPPLRDAEPVQEVIADLERFIPETMRDRGIPGVAIALIREGDVVWTEGFGVANAITRRPNTPETVFEVASNSKVVTAYIALRLVDRGLLSLDEPLNDYLAEPWLPPEYRDVITLRHVVSHSSGLGHGTTSRENLFPPGRGYAYSAVGFAYLQAVIEHVTGQPLEAVAQEMVFTPLGMASSSFVNRPDLTARTANGHLWAIVPAVLFVVLYVISCVVVGPCTLLIARIGTGRWRPGRRTTIGALAVALALSCLIAFVLLRLIGMVEIAWLIATCGLVLTVAFALLCAVGRAAVLSLCPNRRGWQAVLMVVWCVLIAMGLVLLCGTIALPAPRWPAVQADAAGTLRATAGDMAALMIELADPQFLGEETAAQLRTPQIALSDDLSWGAGPGIQHSQQGDALWQWGQLVDFQSVMIIYPERGFGVFVCTNSDLLNADVALEIAHRALGGEIDPIYQGSHRAFDYREAE